MFSLRRNPNGDVDKFNWNYGQFGDAESVSYDVAGLSAGSKIYVHSAYDERHIENDPTFTWRTIAQVVAAGVGTDIKGFSWGAAAEFVVPKTGFISVVVPAELQDSLLFSAE